MLQSARGQPLAGGLTRDPVLADNRLRRRPPSSRRTRHVALLLIAPAVLAALGVWGLGRDGAYGNDESATRWAALLPLPDLFHLLSHLDAVHGLYYLGMHAWLVAVGHGPIALRLPSLLAAVATAGVVTALGRELSGAIQTGVIAGLMFAVNPFVTLYAQTARSYTVVVLVVTLATMVFIRAVDAEHRGAGRVVVLGRWGEYAALVALAGWLNELSLLVLAAHAVTLLVTVRSRRVRVHWLSAAAIAGAAVSPLVVISYGQRGAIPVAMSRASVHNVYLLVADFFGPSRLVVVVTIGCAAIAVVSTLRTSAPRGPSVPGSGGRPLGVVPVALPLLLIPPALVIGESLVGQPLLDPRYVLYSLVAGVLLVADGATVVGQGLLRDRGRVAPWMPAVAVIAFAVLVQIPTALYIRTPDSRLHDYGPPASYVAAHARPGDGVLFSDSFYRMIELGYPEDFRNVHDVGVAVTPKASGTFRGIDAPFAGAEPRILACNRIWVLGVPPPRRLLRPPYLQEHSLLERDFRRLMFRRFHGIDLALWARRLPTGTTTIY